MKKLITILAILTVLVGALFAATENHQIKITVTIAEEVPAFQLKLNSANSNSNAVKFGTAPLNKVDNTPTPVTLDFESDVADDRKVVVDVYIANAAKQSKTYSLAFSGGVFKDNQSVTVVSPVNNTGIAAIAASGTGFTTEATGATADVTFDGAVRCTANSLIAQAKYQYPKADIAPGTYTADIIMTVSTT